MSGTLTAEAILKCTESLPVHLTLASTPLLSRGLFMRFDREKILLGHPDDWGRVLWRLGGFIGPVLDLGDLRPPMRDLWVEGRQRSAVGRVIEAVLPRLMMDPETAARVVAAWKASAPDTPQERTEPS